jgi:alkylation response protein AidB-like acyl-CoA dehydrogenase
MEASQTISSFSLSLTPANLLGPAISAFVIPRNSKGHEVLKAYRLIGMRGANVAHLRLRNVGVRGENLVGGLNRGFSIILDELDRERPAVAAGMMGIARSSFEQAVRYSSTRQQFGRPIRDFEGVSFKIANMAVKLAASRLLILHAARALDRGETARKEGPSPNYTRLKQRSRWRTSLCKSMEVSAIRRIFR